MAYNTSGMIASSVDMVTVRIALPPVETLWAWLNEFPLNNFDDFGPKSEEDLMVEFTRRAHRGEYTWTAYVDEQPAGVIGFAPFSPYCGSFHGICFAKEWHGKGVARKAVSLALNEIFDMGFQKVSAALFRDNLRVRNFLHNLGFRPEGMLVKQTLRGGVPMDMVLVALFKEDWLCRSAAC